MFCGEGKVRNVRVGISKMRRAAVSGRKNLASDISPASKKNQKLVRVVGGHPS